MTVRHKLARSDVHDRVVDATVGILAIDGVAAVSEAVVADAAMIDLRDLRGMFASVPELLLATAVELSAFQALRPPGAGAAGRSAAETVQFLVDQHHDRVSNQPTRFAALVQLSSASMFAQPELRPPLAARARRARRATWQHFELLEHERRIPLGKDLAAIAGAFVDALTGVELCHLVDRDEALRDAAYREVATTVTLRLKRPLA
jgi:hypothetical protein